MMAGQGEYLVVGLGIAGVCLCHELERRGRGFTVVDAADADSASGVAPGVINPLAGKRLNPSWAVEEQLPVALEAYGQLEAALGRQLLHKAPIIRIIRDAEQRTYFERRRQSPTASAFIGDEHPAGHWRGLFKDPLGSFESTVSGYLEVAATCGGYRERMRARGRLVEGRLDPADVVLDAQGVVWRGRRFAWLVLCQGWRGHLGPWFGDLPFKPAKGQMLMVRPRERIDQFPNAIVNSSKWLLPAGGGLYRAGSTYSWEAFDDQPTEDGRQEILDGIREFLDVELDVVEHRAGVRPIMKDYRPVLGIHPDEPHVAIMNGLGSKGVLAAPWAARRLLDHLEYGEPLYEMDVRRFYRKR